MRIHARRRFGILGFQLIEQRARTFGFLPFLKRLAYLRIGAGEGNVVDGRPRVQAGTSDENRTHSPGLQFGYFLADELLEPRHGHGIVRFDDIDEMMPDLRPLLRARFGRADIHAPIHLVCVGVDDFRLFAFACQRFGDGNAQPGFAGCGWSDNGHDLTLHGRIGVSCFVCFLRGLLSVERHRSAPPSDRDRR